MNKWLLGILIVLGVLLIFRFVLINNAIRNVSAIAQKENTNLSTGKPPVSSKECPSGFIYDGKSCVPLNTKPMGLGTSAPKPDKVFGV